MERLLDILRHTYSCWEESQNRLPILNSPVNLSALWVGMQIGVTTLENNMEFPEKWKMELLFDPAFPLLGIYPKNPETPIQKNICTPMFTAALFTIAKTWKQPK